MALDGSKEGNTKPSRVSASLYWFFTWNNYKNEDLALFINDCDDLCELYVMEKEVGESGTPHIQGKIKFKKKGRPIETFKIKEIHWEKSKTWKGHEYCAKDGTTPGVDIWYKGFTPVLAPKIWGWQQELVDRIPTMDTERKIYWYWEPKGGVGKTDLCRYLVLKHKAIVVGGRSQDMKYAIINSDPKPNLIVVNIARGHSVSYSGLEELKDGLFFSSKYESGMCIFPKPKIIVFSNNVPDYEKWSADRYEVTRIGCADTAEAE